MPLACVWHRDVSAKAYGAVLDRRCLPMIQKQKAAALPASNSRLEVLSRCCSMAHKGDGLTDIHHRSGSRKMNNYAEADHWLGTAWLSKEGALCSGVSPVPRRLAGHGTAFPTVWNGLMIAMSRTRPLVPMCPNGRMMTAVIGLRTIKPRLSSMTPPNWAGLLWVNWKAGSRSHTRC